MTDKRELTRAEVRHRRALTKSEERHKAGIICDRVATAVKNTRAILAQKQFTEVLRTEGVQTLPRFLGKKRGDSGRSKDRRSATEEHRLDEAALEFVVAWTFLFPLFSNMAITTHLEKMFPGFISELKDTFIMLVVEGPFPHAMSGHRGRRHAQRYHRPLKGKQRR